MRPAETNILRIGNYYDVFNNFEAHGLDIVKEEYNLIQHLVGDVPGNIAIHKRDNWTWDETIYDFYFVDINLNRNYLMTKIDRKSEMVTGEYSRKITYLQECF